MSQKLFINYRRANSDAHAGRINDTLRDEFDVFFDVDGGIEYYPNSTLLRFVPVSFIPI